MQNRTLIHRKERITRSILPLTRNSLVFLVLGVLASGSGWAQETRGTIVGRVTDISGAVVPNALVDVVNVATEVKVSTRTNEAGNYVAPYLSPGIYRVTAEMKGFKRSDRSNLELRIGDRLEVDIKLETGDVTESVTVTAESPMLESETASMGMEIDPRRVAELPLANGHPFLFF